MYGKYVTAATGTRGSCTIKHSNNYVYDATGDEIDHYHQLQHSHKGLKIASLNVNGIRGHHDELKHLLANTGFHVLALNEAKVDNDIPEQLFISTVIRLSAKTEHLEGVG